MNGWIPSEPQSGNEFKQSEFFGVDRDAQAVRFCITGPAPKRALLERLRDAWQGLLFGWRHGGIDE